MRSGGALELYILLSVSEPKEPNTREFTRACALELYFGGLVVAWWWSRCGLGAMPTALKTRKWEEGFFSIRFLFKFDGFGAFWGSVRGWGALGIGWGARSTHKRTNIQTHKHRNMYLYTNWPLEPNPCEFTRVCVLEALWSFIFQKP